MSLTRLFDAKTLAPQQIDKIRPSAVLANDALVGYRMILLSLKIGHDAATDSEATQFLTHLIADLYTLLKEFM